jgi:hypothetical protein
LTILIPIVIVIGTAKAVHQYAIRPPPNEQLFARPWQRTIAANFPTKDAFVESYAD